MSLTNWAELEILDHMLGTGAWGSPTNVYVSLHVGDPGETGANEMVVTTNAYARKLCTFDAATGTTPATAASNVLLQWVNCEGATGGSNVQYVGIWDALTTGNCIAVGALTTPKDVPAGATFEIASGNLTVTLD